MQVFNYDPISGLTYWFFEYHVIMDVSEITTNFNLSPEEILDLFHKRGILLTDAFEPQDVIPSIYWNYGVCDDEIPPIEYEPFSISAYDGGITASCPAIDESGQFDFKKEYWEL